MPILAVQVTDSDSDKFSDGEYLDDDIEKGNAVMAAVTVVVIFLIFFLCMAIMLTWTLLVLGDHQVMTRSLKSLVFRLNLRNVQGRRIAFQLCSNFPQWSHLVQTEESW